MAGDEAVRRRDGTRRVPLAAACGLALLAAALAMTRTEAFRDWYLRRQPLDSLVRRARSRPHDLPLQLHLVRRLLRAGNAPEAARIAGQAVRAAPAAPEPWIALAEASLQTEQLDVAFAACRRALALDPDAAEAYLILGSAYSRSESSHGAIATFRRYTELRPRDPRGWRSLGREFLRVEEPGNARIAAEHALALQPRDADALAILGEAHRRQGELAAAERCFRDALAAAPHHPDALLGLGRALLDQAHDPDRLAVAIRTLEAAVRFGPDRAEARAELANALAQRGRLEAAVSIWKEALAIAPEDTRILHQLAEGLARLGRRAEAEAVRSAFHQQVRYGREVATLRARLRGAPDPAAAYFALARVHLRFRRPDRAIRALRAGLALAPENVWARRTLTELERRR